MTWLNKPTPTLPPGDQLALMWSEPGLLRIPGAHTPLAALAARKAGFRAVYVSGAALSAMLGLPDLGVMSAEELLFFTRRIYRATGLVLIVDGDTGYGEALNIMRLVRDLEDAGAAAIQIEDQEFPKKCGHLSGKRLVKTSEMCVRVAAAASARTHLRVVARTDAYADEGLEAAISRARAYVEAGADAIFPEALTRPEDFHAVTAAVPVPLLANMTEFGRTPMLTAKEFEEFGFKMVIWPVSALRAGTKAEEQIYTTLAREGTQKGLLSRMQTRQELYELIDYHGYEALDRSILRSVLPAPDGCDD